MGPYPHGHADGYKQGYDDGRIVSANENTALRDENAALRSANAAHKDLIAKLSDELSTVMLRALKAELMLGAYRLKLENE